MIKKLLITYLFLITNVFAGLPPTTVKGQAEAVKTTTFNVEVPYSQATTTAAGTRLLEVGNNNILANGSFEHSTYDTGWTCSLGTKTKETTTVFKGKNSMKIVSAGAGTRCYIYSTTDAAKLKGQQGHATVRVNSTDSVLQVCALAGGTTSAFDTNCVTVPVTTTETPWKTIVIPTIMDGTGNGVVIKSAETLTKTVFIDEVEYKHGLPVQAVNGAVLVGGAVITGCANSWSTTSTVMTRFATQTGCVYSVFGQAIAPSTNIPAITFPSLKGGEYKLEYEGALFSGTANHTAQYQFYDGTNSARELSTINLNTTTGNQSLQTNGLSQSISYSTTQTNVTLEIRGRVSNAANTATISGTTSQQGVIRVYYYPPVSTIYTSDNYKTVSSDSLPFAFKATAIVDSDPVGTFNTYTYAANTNTATISASAPTQTVASMNANGVQVFARAFNAASTSAQPTRVDIKIGKGLKSKEVLAYGDLAKVTAISYISNPASNASEDYSTAVSYDEVSGVLTINAGVSPSAITLRRVGVRLSDYLTYSSGYFVFNAQKNDTINGSFEKIEKCANDYECTDTFSATISSAGVVSNSNVTWISSASWSPAGTLTITYNSNLKDGVSGLSSPMNCNANPSAQGQRATVNSTSTTSVVFESRANDGTGNATPASIYVTCQKGTNDYKPKTAKVASSIGVPTVPGVTTQAIETFSVSYGTTNATTNCTVSPCSFLDQIGNAVSSITRSTGGQYVMNLNKTYSKLKCSITVQGSSVSSMSISNLACYNCNSINFNTTNIATSPSFSDTFGTLLCQGIPQ